jgi:hypothetical protein
MVFRLDIYLGERDNFGIGFSDNVVFRKQYYVQAFPGNPESLYVHTGEKYLGVGDAAGAEQLETIARPAADAEVQKARAVPTTDAAVSGSWEFDVRGTGFNATFEVGVGPA